MPKTYPPVRQNKVISSWVMPKTVISMRSVNIICMNNNHVDDKIAKSCYTGGQQKWDAVALSGSREPLGELDFWSWRGICFRRDPDEGVLELGSKQDTGSGSSFYATDLETPLKRGGAGRVVDRAWHSHCKEKPTHQLSRKTDNKIKFSYDHAQKVIFFLNRGCGGYRPSFPCSFS